MRAVLALVIAALLLPVGIMQAEREPMRDHVVLTEDIDRTGEGSRWTAPHVAVPFYGPRAIYPIHERVWSAINAAMPPRTTTFTPRYGGPASACPAIEYTPIIRVCIVAHDEPWVGVTYIGLDVDGAIILAGTNIVPRSAEVQALHCHEAMHAVTNIPDDYAAMRPDSCVHGFASLPGAYDVAFIQQVYGGEPVVVTPPAEPREKCDRPNYAKKHPKRCGKRRR